MYIVHIEQLVFFVNTWKTSSIVELYTYLGFSVSWEFAIMLIVNL